VLLIFSRVINLQTVAVEHYDMRSSHGFKHYHKFAVIVCASVKCVETRLAQRRKTHRCVI